MSLVRYEMLTHEIAHTRNEIKFANLCEAHFIFREKYFTATLFHSPIGEFYCKTSNENSFDVFRGGAKGIRTPDLLNAIQTRYQLRHDPVSKSRVSSAFLCPLANCVALRRGGDNRARTCDLMHVKHAL